MTSQFSDLIRARFVEAADIDLQLPRVKGPSTHSAFWPTYFHDVNDLNGYGTARLAERRAEFFEPRYKPDAGAVSRWQEVIGWTRLIAVEKDRMMVWRWAFCQASGRSFAAWCRKKQFPRSSAYLTIEKTFQKIALELGNIREKFHMPDENRLGQIGHDMSSLSYTLDECAPTPNHWISPDAMGVNDPGSRDFSWAISQAEKRKTAEARKRKLLGVE